MTNLVEVNFLDVTFNLRNGLYQPYKNPNDERKYINVLSHPIPDLNYKDATTPTNKSNDQKKRKIIWFSFPYNQNVSINIANISFKLVNKHFPRSRRLHKIVNRNTIKTSYSCMSNVHQLIKKHNNFIQNEKNKTTLSPNYHDNNGCPSNGNCRTENVISKCTSLTKNNIKKVYLGFSEGKFKKIQYYNGQ